MQDLAVYSEGCLLLVQQRLQIAGIAQRVLKLVPVNQKDSLLATGREIVKHGFREAADVDEDPDSRRHSVDTSTQGVEVSDVRGVCTPLGLDQIHRSVRTRRDQIGLSWPCCARIRHDRKQPLERAGRPLAPELYLWPVGLRYLTTVRGTRSTTGVFAAPRHATYSASRTPQTGHLPRSRKVDTHEIAHAQRNRQRCRPPTPLSPDRGRPCRANREATGYPRGSLRSVLVQRSRVVRCQRCIFSRTPSRVRGRLPYPRGAESLRHTRTAPDVARL